MRSAAITGTTGSSALAARTARTTATRATPARGTATKAATSSGGARGGRGMSAWKKAAKASASADYNRLDVEAGTKYVVAFLEDGPFEVVWVHWASTATEDGRFVRVPRNCPKTKDEDAECPLCEKAIDCKPVAYFNVVDLDEPTKVYLWEAGKDAAGRIEKLYDELQAVPEDRGGPLELNSEGVYAVVSKEKQKNQRFAYSVGRIKERDLDEDYQLKPMTAEQFEALEPKLYDEKVIRYNTTAELREFADTLQD